MPKISLFIFISKTLLLLFFILIILSLLSSLEINPFKLLLKKKSEGSGSFIIFSFLFFSLFSSSVSSTLNEEK